MDTLILAKTMLPHFTKSAFLIPCLTVYTGLNKKDLQPVLK
jgi:hypothetical protein